MTPRKAKARTWPWSCDCGAFGEADSAEAAAKAFLTHWGSSHQAVPW